MQVPLVGGTIGADICTHEQIPGMATTSRRSPLSPAYHSVSKENWGVNAQQQHAWLFKGHWIHLLVAEQGWVGVGQAGQRDCRGGQGWAGGVRSGSARVSPDRVNVQCVQGLAALVHLSTARRCQRDRWQSCPIHTARLLTHAREGGLPNDQAQGHEHSHCNAFNHTQEGSGQQGHQPDRKVRPVDLQVMWNGEGKAQRVDRWRRACGMGLRSEA